jgi:hypothetical protein
MTKNEADKTGKRRTQVKDLPKQETELSKAEQKKVKGGPRNTTFLPSIGRSSDSNT